MRSELLRMWSGKRHGFVQDVAIDQCEQARVLDAANRVKQERAVRAIDGDADVPGVQSSNGKLASEIVAADW